MKIQSHEIAMQSQHTQYKSILESQMSFSTYFDAPPPYQLQDFKEVQIKEPKEADISSFFSSNMRSIREIIQNLINMIQDKREKLPDSEEENIDGYTHLSFYEKYEEYENLDFSTQGHIVTDSGSLDINLNFSMTRSFAIENKIDIYTTFDPLIINLNEDIPNLSNDTFSFDLDNDVKCDQISKLKAGNGFLSLDKNGDGVINQGSELFGTLTGNGFKELSQYDEDNNFWIDENDSIFDKLQIWLKNEDNEEKELMESLEQGEWKAVKNFEEEKAKAKTAARNTLLEIY